jgi:hypothetical protein
MQIEKAVPGLIEVSLTLEQHNGAVPFPSPTTFQ